MQIASDPTGSWAHLFQLFGGKSGKVAKYRPPSCSGKWCIFAKICSICRKAAKSHPAPLTPATEPRFQWCIGSRAAQHQQASRLENSAGIFRHGGRSMRKDISSPAPSSFEKNCPVRPRAPGEDVDFPIAGSRNSRISMHSGMSRIS